MIAEAEAELVDEGDQVVEPASLDRVIRLKQQEISQFVSSNNRSISAVSNIRLSSTLLEPKLLSHPSHLSGSRETAINNKRFLTSFCKRLETKLSLLNFTIANPQTAATPCVSTMSLDSSGSLLAVSSGKGLVTVYDVDEMMFAIQRRFVCILFSVYITNYNSTLFYYRQLSIAPALYFEAKRTVSVLLWSVERPDELLVAFTYSSLLSLYNLALESSDPLFCRILSPTSNATNGGNVSAMFWTDPITRAEHVFAGGTTGIIRCWRRRDNSQYTFAWHVSLHSEPYLFVNVIDEHKLIAVNEAGFTVMWDLNQRKPTAFSSTGNEPCMIRSFAINGGGCPVEKVIYRENRFPDLLTVFTTNGIILHVSLNTQKVLSSITATRVGAEKIVKGLKDVHSTATLHADALQNPTNFTSQQQGDASHITHTDVALASQPKEMAVVVQSRVTGSKIIFMEANPYPQACTDIIDTRMIRKSLKTEIIESCLIRSTEFSYTLPGHIVQAIPGERDILTSHDLQHYLSSQAVASSALSRSFDVRFECGSDSHEGQVSCVRSHVITLVEPYQGPEIIHSEPKTLIRTKLTPRSFPADSSPLLAAQEEKERQQKLIIRELALSPGEVVTKLEAHPTRPLFFAGLDDGRLLVVGPGSGREEDEEDELKGESEETRRARTMSSLITRAPLAMQQQQVVHMPPQMQQPRAVAAGAFDRREDDTLVRGQPIPVITAPIIKVDDDLEQLRFIAQANSSKLPFANNVSNGNKLLKQPATAAVGMRNPFVQIQAQHNKNNTVSMTNSSAVGKRKIENELVGMSKKPGQKENKVQGSSSSISKPVANVLQMFLKKK